MKYKYLLHQEVVFQCEIVLGKTNRYYLLKGLFAATQEEGQ